MVQKALEYSKEGETSLLTSIGDVSLTPNEMLPLTRKALNALTIF